jgi:hypothetical protein
MHGGREATGLRSMINENRVSGTRLMVRAGLMLAILSLVAVRSVMALPQESQSSRPLRVPAFSA